MNCLILGATGFIGGQIARMAVTHGWRVTAMRRRPNATGDIADLPVQWVEGNLDDDASLRAVMRDWMASAVDRGSTVLYHCAGAYPHNPRTMNRDVQAAAGQMQRVLEAARDSGAGRLVYTSSYTTIGQPVEPGRLQPVEPGRLADERDFYVPGSSGDPYYEAKWAMEAAALAAAQMGLPVVVLCPTAVFGPGDVHMAVSGPLLAAAKGRLPVYPDATLGVIDVRDVAAAHIAAAVRGRAGERYILNAHNGTLYEVLAAMAHAAGVRPPQVRIGPPLLNIVAAAGQLAPGGEASFLKTIRFWRPVANGKAVRELGLTTRPLSETMADTLAWFHTRGLL